MRSRVLILATLVGLAAVVLVIAVAVAGAGQSDPLPAVSAPDLLGKMAQAGDVTAVSGDVAWQNDLFGDLAQAGGMAQSAGPVAAHEQRVGTHLGERRRRKGGVAGRRGRPGGRRGQDRAHGLGLRPRAEHGQEGRRDRDGAGGDSVSGARRHRAHAGDDHPVPAAGRPLRDRRGGGPDQGRRPRRLPAAHDARRHRHRPRLRRGGGGRRDHAAACSSTCTPGAAPPRRCASASPA